MDLTSWTTEWVVTFFVLGLALLFVGGHLLVDGSSRLARLMGIHPIVIGLTVVAFGTSMPEFVVSLFAAIKDRPDVALGNVVGSNISNMGLILGLAAALRPISISLRILKLEMPLVLLISLVFWGLCANAQLSRLDGLVLIGGFLAYFVVVFKKARHERPTLQQAYQQKLGTPTNLPANLFLVIFGIAVLTTAANMIVDSATEISTRLGVSELILGLTAVAIGTSLPELATSVVAAWKKEGDISIGNILGSNIFNMMAIAGPTAAIHPLNVSNDLIIRYLPMMVILTAVLFPLLRTGRELSRFEGGFLLVSYFAILSWWAVSQ